MVPPKDLFLKWPLMSELVHKVTMKVLPDVKKVVPCSRYKVPPQLCLLVDIPKYVYM